MGIAAFLLKMIADLCKTSNRALRINFILICLAKNKAIIRKKIEERHEELDDTLIPTSNSNLAAF